MLVGDQPALGAQIAGDDGDRVERALRDGCQRAVRLDGRVGVVLVVGALTAVEEIEIKWPSGTTQRLGKTPADQTLKITEPRPSERGG